MQEFLIPAKPDLQAARENWLRMLARERRLSPETVEAYERDTRQFLHFLTGHCGGSPGISDIANLRPADLRGFLAARRAEGAGARTLGRGLAGIRSLLRFLERRGLVNAAGAAALRAPRQPKSLPKPLTASDAKHVVSVEGQLAEEPWIAARNAAVLTLALWVGPAHFGGARPVGRRSVIAERHRAAGHRQGRQDAAGAGAAGGIAGDRRIPPALPLPSRPQGPFVSRRAWRPAQPGHRPARHGEAALGAQPARHRHAACVASFLRDASAWARRRSADHPGTAWAMPACRRRRSTPASIRRDCSKSTSRRIRGHNPSILQRGLTVLPFFAPRNGL